MPLNVLTPRTSSASGLGYLNTLAPAGWWRRSSAGSFAQTVGACARRRFLVMGEQVVLLATTGRLGPFDPRPDVQIGEDHASVLGRMCVSKEGREAPLAAGPDDPFP